MEVTVYGRKESRAFRVLWMLEELGLAYEYHPSKPHSEELVRIHPKGKIPVAIIDSVVIADSTAILTYLAETNDSFTFQTGTREKAKQDGLTFMILDELETCVWNAAKHSFVLPLEKRIKTLKPTLKWEFSKALEYISHNLDLGNYLMGTTMTIPDFLLTHCLDWAIAAKFDTFPDTISTYHTRMVQRPSYQKVVNI